MLRLSAIACVALVACRPTAMRADGGRADSGIDAGGGVDASIGDAGATDAGEPDAGEPLASGCLNFDTTDLNFGTTLFGCERPMKTVAFTNTCATNARIDAVRLYSTPNPFCPDDAGCENFRLSGVAGALGVILPGQTRAIGVTYTPSQQEGPITGAVAIDDHGNPGVTYVVTMRAQQFGTRDNEDNFRNEAKPRADLLFVIDDSSAMATARVNVPANVKRFVDYAIDFGTNVNVAFTTTSDDRDDAGQCVVRANNRCGRFLSSDGGRSVINWNTPDAGALAAALSDVGIEGSSTPTCLGAALHAVELAVDGGPNSGFRRPNSSLSIVCVMASREQGLLGTEAKLRMLPGTDISVVGPFTPDASCTLAYDAPDAGRLSQVTSVRGDICAEDWATSLMRFGRVAWPRRDSYSLTARPSSVAAIRVFVDGVELAAAAWRYDSTQNAVSFTSPLDDVESHLISTRYQVACP